MKFLLEKYRDFRRGAWPELRDVYQRHADEQRPRYLVIACSDSRVDPHSIFNAGPGELFVIRNVANLVPPFEQGEGLHGTAAAIEFAVCKLEIQCILVLGHARCGGVTAALDRSISADLRFLGPWLRLLDPVVERCVHTEDPQTALEKESILISMERLLQYPFVADAVQSRGLAIEGARFGIADGRLEVYDHDAQQFSNVT